MLVHWLMKTCPLLIVGVAEAEVVLVVVPVAVWTEVVVPVVVWTEEVVDAVLELVWADVDVFWVAVEVAFCDVVVACQGAAAAAMNKVTKVRRVWGSMIWWLDGVCCCRKALECAVRVRRCWGSVKALDAIEEKFLSSGAALVLYRVCPRGRNAVRTTDHIAILVVIVLYVGVQDMHTAEAHTSLHDLRYAVP